MTPLGQQLRDVQRERGRQVDVRTAATLRHREAVAAYVARTAPWERIIDDLLDRYDGATGHRQPAEDRRIIDALNDARAAIRRIGPAPREPMAIAVAAAAITRADIRIAEIRDEIEGRVRQPAG